MSKPNTMNTKRRNDKFKQLHGDMTRKEWAKEKRELKQEKKKEEQEKRKKERERRLENKKPQRKKKRKKERISLVQVIMSMGGKATYYLKDKEDRIKSCIPRYQDGFPIKKKKRKIKRSKNKKSNK